MPKIPVADDLIMQIEGEIVGIGFPEERTRLIIREGRTFRAVFLDRASAREVALDILTRIDGGPDHA